MFLLYGLCLFILIDENYGLKDTIHKKDMEFVEILKQDLRRNNDDYAEMRRSFSQTNNSLQSLNNVNINDVRYKIITTRDNKKVTKTVQSNMNNNYNDDGKDVRFKIIDKIKRRVNDAFKSKELVNNHVDSLRRVGEVKDDRNTSEIPLNNNHDNVQNISNVTQATRRSIWNDMHKMFLKGDKIMRNYKLNLLRKNFTSTVPTLTTTSKPENLKKHKKHRKITRLEKFKKFMQRNRGLIKDHMGTKNQATTVSAKTLATQSTKQQSKVMNAHVIHDLLREALNNNDPMNNNDVVSNIKAALNMNPNNELYNRRINNTDSLTELPKADMLDMLPAKGGRIHSKRVNGHLCQRHVLIPEGPKYNSRGEIYLPPHASAHIGHEYNVTDMPRLVLPKCCNCCHKSVLGCE